jgi:hypothetical protein
MRTYEAIKAHVACGGVAILIYALFFVGHVVILASLGLLWVCCRLSRSSPLVASGDMAAKETASGGTG